MAAFPRVPVALHFGPQPGDDVLGPGCAEQVARLPRIRPEIEQLRLPVPVADGVLDELVRTVLDGTLRGDIAKYSASRTPC